MDKIAQEITFNCESLLAEIPSSVTVVAAAKTRSAQEVEAARRGGIRHIGHNYIQEAQRMKAEMAPESRAQLTWHFIGHLQRNKAALALSIFDFIETLDTIPLATDLNRRLAAGEKKIPLLIEVNSGREENKSGVFPENVVEILHSLAGLERLHIQGLMTMGPACQDPSELRPFFHQTRRLFEEISRQNIPGIDMRYLSMGMSDSYLIAIEEGANMIRIGTKLFGPRPLRN